VKRILLVGLIGFIFFTRYLFLVTTDEVEEIIGGYESLRVLDIQTTEQGIKPLILPSEEGYYKYIKIGGITFLYQYSYPMLKLKIKEKEYPLLMAKYSGPLYIYIPRFFESIFGKNIYSLRFVCLICFLIFSYLHIHLLTERLKIDEGILSTIFLITITIFGSQFLYLMPWNHQILFICLVLLMMKIVKIIRNSNMKSSDLLSIFLLGGIMVHFHALAGGAIFASVILGFILTIRKKGISFEIHPVHILSGFFLFLSLISPLLLSFPDFISYILQRKEGKLIFFAPLRLLIVFAAALFLPSNAIYFALFGKPRFEYIPLSWLSGILYAYTIYWVVKNRKKEPLLFLTFLSSFIYLFFLLFAGTRPYHTNSILLLVSLFIIPSLKDIEFLNSAKKLRAVMLLAIACNIIQLEMLRNDIKNSSYSLTLHKNVAHYLEENGINKLFNLAGPYTYQFISKKPPQTVGFYLYLQDYHSMKRIYLSLLLSRGNVILVEDFKRRAYSTGISYEEVLNIARKTGVNLKVLKGFPSEKAYKLLLIEVQ